MHLLDDATKSLAVAGWWTNEYNQLIAAVHRFNFDILEFLQWIFRRG